MRLESELRDIEELAADIVASRVTMPRRIVQTHNEKRLLILNALRNHPDGLTVPEIARITGLHIDGGIRDVIEREHGFSIYIDRWEQRKRRAKSTAVYALCDCPQDCPKPTA
jgi:hypothetical protein